jgi:hypothetical protein
VKVLFFLHFLLIFSFALAQPHKTENIIIITLDGFRWQELFAGADSAILFNKDFTTDCSTQEKFWDTSPHARRENLLPFIWNVIGTKGQLYGNRNFNNRVNCANPHWFSYPGYSEMLTGLVDKRIRSNKKIKNPNYTVLEYINNQDEYQGKVAAFSTWDVIPFIIRAAETGIPSNSGSMLDRTISVGAGEALLNGIQEMFSVPYGDCQDVFTFYFAFQFLKKERPRVLYISLEETDEHAHGGRYDKYLRAAYNTDSMIAELWDWLQNDKQYKDKTTLLLTTDHGRGNISPTSWKKHGRLALGSGQIWFAVLGPDTRPHGEMKSHSKYFQKQFAKTAAAFLGLDYSNVVPVGDRIQSMHTIRALTAR